MVFLQCQKIVHQIGVGFLVRKHLIGFEQAFGENGVFNREIDVRHICLGMVGPVGPVLPLKYSFCLVFAIDQKRKFLDGKAGQINEQTNDKIEHHDVKSQKECQADAESDKNRNQKHGQKVEGRGLSQFPDFL